MAPDLTSFIFSAVVQILQAKQTEHVAVHGS